MENVGVKFFLQKRREQTVIWVDAAWPTAICNLWKVPQNEAEDSWCQICFPIDTKERMPQKFVQQEKCQDCPISEGKA